MAGETRSSATGPYARANAQAALNPPTMRWNEHTLRRAETWIAVVVVALLIVAYLVSKVR